MSHARILLATELLLSFLFLRTSSSALAQCTLATVSSSAVAANNRFGVSVAVSGNVAVVGSYFEDTGAADAGTAYVFNATTGALVTTLNNPSPTANDNFGYSVAISGNLVVVGTYADDAGANDAGTAYVFNATTGGLVATLNNPAPDISDLFGVSVAISGNVAVVGAYRDDPGGVGNAGTAYVFDATTGGLTATLNNPAPALTDLFGWSVAVSGNVAVVGAYRDDAGGSDAGAAYVFNATTGVLTATLAKPIPVADDQFGYSVAISGNVAVVGAPFDDAAAADAGTAYVFNAATGALTATLNNPAPTVLDEFGYAVAVSGNLAVVGARQDDAGATDAGGAYVFDVTTGGVTSTLSNPAPAADDGFGTSVAVDGNVYAVGSWMDDAGATNAGSAYTFSCAPPTPSPTASASPTASSSPTPSASPTPTASSTPSPTPTPTSSPTLSPTASASPTVSTSPTPTDSPTASPTDTPTDTPTLSPTETESPTPTGTPSPTPTVSPTSTPSPSATASPTPSPVPQCVSDVLLQTIPDPFPAASDYFAYVVAVSGDVAVVGVPFDAPGGVAGAGTAYVFNARTGVLIATLNNPAPAAFDEFGYAVSISGNVAVVGALGNDPGGVSDAGTAYVFNATTGALTAVLNNPLPTTNDQFGVSVAIDGNTAVVGAYFDDPGSIADAGRAYIFNAATGTLITTLSNPAPAVSDQFGYAVAISGNLAVVGAFGDNPGAVTDAGTAYVFNATTGALTATLNNPAPLPLAYFGAAVAIDGNGVVVGAFQDSPGAMTGAGRAHVFDAATGALTATLNNPDPTIDDNFGYSVAISGDVVVVGADLDDPAGVINAGTAYLFDATTGALTGTPNRPGAEADDFFGYSVGISGELVVVGALLADDPGGVDDAGVAFSFACPPTPAPNAVPDWAIYE